VKFFLYCYRGSHNVLPEPLNGEFQEFGGGVDIYSKTRQPELQVPSIPHRDRLVVYTHLLRPDALVEKEMAGVWQPEMAFDQCTTNYPDYCQLSSVWYLSGPMRREPTALRPRNVQSLSTRLLPCPH
jgi:hypothetical protein